MSRIISYPYDTNVQDKDAWIGSEASTTRTKQYTAEAVADYLNINGKISIAAQMVFKFVPNGNSSGDFTGPTDGSTLAGITTMQLSINDRSGQNVVAFMDYLVGNNILISEQNNISTFGHYTIDSYTDDGDFYRLNLTSIGGNGNLAANLFYDFAVFTLSTDSADTFVFTQAQPEATWNIQHNLNKFPSVSVVNNNEIIMYGDTTYIDSNNITITFSGGFSGKAYLN
jgi:hypothetical protein